MVTHYTLLHGSPDFTLNRLRLIQNHAARIITGTKKLKCVFDYISDTLISPDEINAYHNSERYKNTVMEIKKFDPLQDILAREVHTQMRDLIVTEIVLNNATRAGGIVNMTTLQAKNAEKNTTRKLYVVKVIVHQCTEVKQKQTLLSLYVQTGEQRKHTEALQMS